MKFQNSRMHSSKVRLCINVYNVKNDKDHNSRSVFFRIYSKVYQVIYSSLPIYSSNFKALVLIVF